MHQDVFLAVCLMATHYQAHSETLQKKCNTDLSTLHNIDQSTESLKKRTTHPHKSPKDSIFLRTHILTDPPY